MTPTREQLKQLEQLAARMNRDSRWQVTEAAFKLGLRLGAERCAQLEALLQELAAPNATGTVLVLTIQQKLAALESS